MIFLLIDEQDEGDGDVWGDVERRKLRAMIPDRIAHWEREGWTLFSFVRHADKAILTHPVAGRRVIEIINTEIEG